MIYWPTPISVIRERIVDHLELVPGMSVLEIGAGVPPTYVPARNTVFLPPSEQALGPIRVSGARKEIGEYEGLPILGGKGVERIALE